jgi:hypothetical protein
VCLLRNLATDFATTDFFCVLVGGYGDRRDLRGPDITFVLVNTKQHVEKARIRMWDMKRNVQFDREPCLVCACVPIF